MYECVFALIINTLRLNVNFAIQLASQVDPDYPYNMFVSVDSHAARNNTQTTKHKEMLHN